MVILAENTIDTLELEIQSSSENAVKALDKLAKKLLEVNRSFKILNNGSMRSYAKSIGMVTSALKEFSNLKIKAPEIGVITKEIDKLSKFVTKESSEIAKTLSGSFGIKGFDANEIRKSMVNIGSLLASGNKKEAAYAVNELGNNMVKMASNVKIADAEMEAFYNTLLKVSKIKVPENLPKSLPDDWKGMDGLLRQKMSTKTGTSIDSLSEQWKTQFPGIFNNLNVDTVEDQFLNLNEVVKKCRDGITAPLDDSGILESSVWSELVESTNKLKSNIESAKNVIGKTGGTEKVKTSGVSQMFNDLRKLGEINTSGISNIGFVLKELADGIRALDGLTFNAEPLMQVSNFISQATKKNKFKNIDGLKDIGNVFREFVNTSNSLAGIQDVSSSINRFVSSIARLANAGSKTKESAIDLPILGNGLKKIIKSMSGSAKISASVNTFTQSIARLANAGNKTGQTASQLSHLAKATLDFFNAMKSAPKISDNTLRMTEALSKLSSSGGKIGNVTSKITSSFSKMANVGGKALNTLKRVASGISSSFKHIGSSSSHLGKASLGMANLIKTAVGFRIGYGLLNFGKQSLKLGADITEVQNVVDVAFGNMSGMVDEFASTASDKFGLSEIAAKQYSGTMMAMLKSSGVIKESAAKMSTTLAGLAGDIASFYNIDTDLAFTKIRSGIAGEIEPLRQLGISMTVANLEAFALSQGIAKSYREMTQAEQVMLRYNYLMWASADAQGDFARTSGNYANQIRMLKLNIQQLSATIGQGIIAAILPAIHGLNALVSILLKAANAFKVFMYTLMGKKVESTKGIVQDIAGLGDAGGVAAGGLGDAAGEADKLKKKLSLLPFDQLNQLTDNSDKSGSGSLGGSGGIGSGNLENGLDDILSDDKEGPINEWAKRIREAFLAEDWEKLGFEIADGLNRGLQKVYDVINWKNVGPKITAFTSAFTQTFNSFVHNYDWNLLGRVVGAGINTAVNTFNQLVGPNGIDFVSLGNKLSEGFRGLVNEIQWSSLGNALGNGFMISWNMAKGFINNMWAESDLTSLNGWQELGISLANGTKSLFERIDFASIGNTLANGFNGVFETLKAYINQMTSSGSWSEIAINIYTGLNNMIQGIDWASAGKTLSGFVVNLLGVFKKVAQETDWEGFGRGIGEFLSNIDWFTIIGQVGTIILEAFSGMLVGLFDTSTGKVILGFLGGLLAIKSVFGKVDMAKSVFDWLKGPHDKFFEFIGSLKGKISTGIGEGITGIAGAGGLFSKLGTGASTVVSKITPILGSIGSVLFSPKGLLIAGIVAGVAAIILNWDKIKESAGKVKDWVSKKWEETKEATSKVWGNVSEFMSKTWDNLKTWSSEKFKSIKENVSKVWSDVKQKTSDIWGNVKDFTKNTWDNLKTSASEKFGKIKESVSTAWSNAKQNTSDIWSNIKSNVAGIWSGLNRDASTSFSNIDKTVSNSASSSGRNMTREWQNIQKSMRTVFENINSDFSKSIGSISKSFNSLSSSISKSVCNLYKAGKEAGQSFAKGFRSVHIATPHIYTRSYTRHKVGDKTFSTPNFGVNWYKVGGLFNKASVIGVGEAGKEAVLPLENKRTMSMIADSIVKSSSGMGLNEETLSNAVARGVSMAMLNGQNPVNVTCYAELRTEDNEVLARAVTKGQRSIDSRMNPTLQFSY